METKAYRFKNKAVVHSKCLTKYQATLKHDGTIFSLVETVPTVHIHQFDASNVGRFECCNHCGTPITA